MGRVWADALVYTSWCVGGARLAHFALRLAEPGLEGARGRVDASLMAPQIFLDSAIREWVLVPVFVAMFLFGVLRAQVSKVSALSVLQTTTFALVGVSV